MGRSNEKRIDVESELPNRGGSRGRPAPAFLPQEVESLFDQAAGDASTIDEPYRDSIRVERDRGGSVRGKGGRRTAVDIYCSPVMSIPQGGGKR
jgi:hypothetical protein